MGREALICSACGFNKTTGAAAQTRVARAQKEKRVRSGPRLELNPTWVGLILVGLEVLFFLGSFAQPAMMAGLVAVYVLCALANFVLLIVYCVKDEQIGWLVASLIIPLVVLYYVFCVSERGLLKATMLATILGAVMFGVLVASNPEMMKELESAAQTQRGG